MSAMKKMFPKSSGFYLTVFDIDGKGLHQTSFTGTEDQLLNMVEKLNQVVLEKLLKVDVKGLIDRVTSDMKKGKTRGSMKIKKPAKRRK